MFRRRQLQEQREAVPGPLCRQAGLCSGTGRWILVPCSAGHPVVLRAAAGLGSPGKGAVVTAGASLGCTRLAEPVWP